MIHVIASGFVESEDDEVVALYAAPASAPPAALGSGWQAVLLERARERLLDPAAAAAAGARHAQLASGLPGGGLALSCHKLVEDGARVMMLLAPGLFRLDVRPVEDTLQVLTRSLHEGARWGTQPTAATDYGRKAEDTPEPRARSSRSSRSWSRGRCSRASRSPSTIDRERGLTHFVAQAIVREAEPGVVRWRAPG